MAARWPASPPLRHGLYPRIAGPGWLRSQRRCARKKDCSGRRRTAGSWQSGLDAKPSDVGEHDWALFYVPSVGWVYADLSYGGSSYLRGAMKRWDFYFGNLDPYRIPINDGFQQEFVPAKKHWRIDPYDNQCEKRNTLIAD